MHTHTHTHTHTHVCIQTQGGHGKAGHGGHGARNAKDRTRYERYMDVETFWKSLQPDQRRELLKVPLTSLLQGGRVCRRGRKNM
eukprot:scaffold59910_cov22-Tisochrysis_lutea.AAC.3